MAHVMFEAHLTPVTGAAAQPYKKECRNLPRTVWFRLPFDAAADESSRPVEDKALGSLIGKAEGEY
jgi:hypothetical protein